MPFMLYRKREALPVTEPTPLPFDNLNPKKNGCKYPFGDPREKTFRFCDAPRESNVPYCQEHSALCYLRKMTTAEAKAARTLMNSVDKRQRF